MFLVSAPYIVILFKQSYGVGPGGERKTHYYNEISVSIAEGLFIAAVQVGTSLHLPDQCLYSSSTGRDLITPTISVSL